MDRDHLEYNLQDIRKYRGTPFQMVNEELADEQFPYIKAEFPEAQMIKCGIFQYIVITRHAGTTLIEKLETLRKDYQSRANALQKAIIQLRGDSVTP